MTDATAATTATRGCVHCHATLVPQTHETVQVLACPSGHGVFVDADALQVALRDRTEDRPESEEQAAEAAMRTASVEELVQAEGVRTCPVCGTEMSKRMFAYESGVAVDVCLDHGIWLDEGELHRVEAWYEAQEKHRDADRQVWGGPNGKLEQIEAEYERAHADDEGSLHWGPFGRIVSRLSYWWARRDDR
jgi:Zn-finger nucleic acid-binding protein